MQLYPEDIEKRLGFDIVRSTIKKLCLSDQGAVLADKMSFSTDAKRIERFLDQTKEFKEIIVEGLLHPSSGFVDIRNSLERLNVKGLFFEEEELFQLLACLKIVNQWIEFFADEETQSRWNNLYQLVAPISIDPYLVREIDSAYLPNGKLADHASPALKKIRQEIIAEGVSLRKSALKILNKANQDGMADEDALPTIRDGRMVIPVKSEYKRAIRGLIHDESSTGLTTYLEPDALFDINNRIKELLSAERRELIRILTVFTDKIRDKKDDFIRAVNILGVFDFIRAKAKLAITLNAVKPDMLKSSDIDLKKAYHAGLVLFSGSNKHIVPMDVKLDQDQRIIVISGPNAGGKSIAMKTVGLLVYMYQCGLLVPVAENSSMGIFKNIMVDIGDQQSIENDLSTYSAHLHNMKEMMLGLHHKSLFLIDEMGSGTEPDYGASIAETILESIHKSGAKGVVTTHYPTLKSLAVREKGMLNAAMEFDVVNIKPLYKISYGKPGSSFAIELGKKIGLDPTILEKAANRIGRERVNYDQSLKDLAQEKHVLEQKINRLTQKEEELNTSIEEFRATKKYFEEHKSFILKRAKEEAVRVIADANKDIERTIREIKEHKADKAITAASRQELKEKQVSLERSIQKMPSKVASNSGVVVIKVGDTVNVKNKDLKGRVVAITNNEAEIVIGDLIKTHISVDQLEKTGSINDKNTQPKSGKSNVNTTMIHRRLDFHHEIDVRGKRTEEALRDVESFIDNAVITGTTDLRIIHGKGDGILRKMIREYLKSFSIVGSVANEHVERGGDGVTLITLNV